MLTATAVLCNSIIDCLKLEIPSVCKNHYPGIVKIYRGKYQRIFLLEMVETLCLMGGLLLCSVAECSCVFDSKP